jgi:hypothetical protein
MTTTTDLLNGDYSEFPRLESLDLDPRGFKTFLSRVFAFHSSADPFIFDDETLGELILRTNRSIDELKHTPLDLRKYPLIRPGIHLQRLSSDRDFKTAAAAARRDHGVKSVEYAIALMGASVENTPLQLRLDIDRLLDPKTRPYKAYTAIVGVPPSLESKVLLRNTLIEFIPEITTARCKKEADQAPRRKRTLKPMKSATSADPYLSKGITFDSLALSLGLVEELSHTPIERSECLRLTALFSTKSNKRKIPLTEKQAFHASIAIYSMMFFLKNRHYFKDIGSIKVTTPSRANALHEAACTAIKINPSLSLGLIWVGDQGWPGTFGLGYFLLPEIEPLQVRYGEAKKIFFNLRREGGTPQALEQAEKNVAELKNTLDSLKDVARLAELTKELFIGAKFF